MKRNSVLRTCSSSLSTPSRDENKKVLLKEENFEDTKEREDFRSSRRQLLKTLSVKNVGLGKFEFNLTKAKGSRGRELKNVKLFKQIIDSTLLFSMHF